MSNPHMKYSVFPLQEYETRFEKARKLMEEYEFDALLLCQREHVEYFSGFWSLEWMTKEQIYPVILPREGEPVLIMADLMKGTAAGTSWIKNIQIYVAQDHGDEQFVPLLVKSIKEAGLAKSRIGMESGVGTLLRMPIGYFEAIKAALPAMKLLDASELIQRVMMVKSQLEIENIRKACAITCRAYEKTFSSLRVGISEKELYRIHAIAMFEEGASEIGFINLRGGPRAMSGSNPTDRLLERGDIFFCDSGAKYEGYWCDMLRIAHIGEPCPQEDMKLYSTVIKAQRAGFEAIKPGVKAGEVHAAVQDVFKQSGYTFRSLFMIGHGVGLDAHERPWIRIGDDTVLEEGMVITLEPWMHNPERGTFCNEDVFLITEAGYEILTPLPREELYTVPG